MLLSEALAAVNKLLGRYPQGKASIGDGYLGGIAAVLTHYPRMVTASVADPLKGVPAKCKFIPTAADVIAWCETESAWLKWVHEVDQRERDTRKAAREAAEAAERLEASRARRPTLDELRARYGPTWGITDPDRKVRHDTPEQARAKLISEFGMDLVDSVPDQPSTFQKLVANV